MSNTKAGRIVLFNIAVIPGNERWVPALVSAVDNWMLPVPDDKPHPGSSTVALHVFPDNGPTFFVAGPIYEGIEIGKWKFL